MSFVASVIDMDFYVDLSLGNIAYVEGQAYDPVVSWRISVATTTTFVQLRGMYGFVRL